MRQGLTHNTDKRDQATRGYSHVGTGLSCKSRTLWSLYLHFLVHLNSTTGSSVGLTRAVTLNQDTDPDAYRERQSTQ